MQAPRTLLRSEFLSLRPLDFRCEPSLHVGEPALQSHFMTPTLATRTRVCVACVNDRTRESESVTQ